MGHAGWKPIVFMIVVSSLAAVSIALAQSVKTSPEDAIFKTQEDLNDAETALAAVDKTTGCADLKALLDRAQKIFEALKADLDLLNKLDGPPDADVQEFRDQLGDKIENYLGVKGATVYEFNMFRKIQDGILVIESKLDECNKSQAKIPGGGTAVSGPTTPTGGSGATSDAIQSNIPGLLKVPTTPLGGSGATSTGVQSGVPSRHRVPTTPLGGVQNLKSQTSTTAKGVVTNTNVGAPIVSGGGVSTGKAKTVTRTKVGSSSSSKSGTTMNTTVGRPTITFGGGGLGF